MIHLVIEPGENNPGLPVQVHEQMPVGALVARLVTQLGYPQANASGSPLWYSLRPVSSGQILSADQRFAESRIVNGTRLVLEEHTQLAAPSIFQLHYKRRRVVSLLLTCSVAGLTAGVGTSLWQTHGRAGTPAQAHSAGNGMPLLRAATPLFTFSGHQATVYAVAWNSQGTQLASGGNDEALLLWNTDGSIQQRLSHAAPIRAIAWSPGGDRVASGAAAQVTFFNAFSGAVLAQRTRHTAPVTSLAWTARGRQQLVSSAQDRLAVVWNTTRYVPQTIFARHTTAIEAVSWAHGGTSVASSSDGGAVRYWTAQTGQEVHPFYQDAQVPMRTLAFAPDDFRLAVGGDDGVIRMYQAQLCLKTGPGVDGVACLDAPQRFSASQLPVFALAWSPDGKFLATGHQDGTVTIWNAQTLQKLFLFVVESESPVRSLSWSPAGNMVAAAAGNLVVLWDLHS